MALQVSKSVAQPKLTVTKGSSKNLQGAQNPGYTPLQNQGKSGVQGTNKSTPNLQGNTGASNSSSGNSPKNVKLQQTLKARVQAAAAKAKTNAKPKGK